jgi:hypothetical protein
MTALALLILFLLVALSWPALQRTIGAAVFILLILLLAL